jgi:hypothetical protein
VCETSALGRALANAGLAGADPSKRASREEMQKATRAPATSQPSGTGSPRPASEKQLNAIRAMCKKAGRTLPAGLEGFTAAQASETIQKLQDTLDSAPVSSDAAKYYSDKESGGYTGD